MDICSSFADYILVKNKKDIQHGFQESILFVNNKKQKMFYYKNFVFMSKSNDVSTLENNLTIKDHQSNKHDPVVIPHFFKNYKELLRKMRKRFFHPPPPSL